MIGWLLTRWRAHRSPVDARGKWKRQNVDGARVLNVDGRWFARVDGTITGPVATYGDALAVVTERYDTWGEVEFVNGKRVMVLPPRRIGPSDISAARGDSPR